MNFHPKKFLCCTALLLGSWLGAHAGTAVGIGGLYYTGTDNSGGLIAGGTQESHWSVTYAYASGTSGNTTYQGNAYVVGGTYVDAGWVQNTSTAQWIVPPGARTSAGGNSGTANLGGTYLPGNGTTGTNRASYVYTLAFEIWGTGNVGEVATNQISISLTLAADDQAKVYINPTLNANGSVNTGSSTLGASLTSAWNNTTAITLQNYGASPNATFRIGTNYLVVQVDNTNSIVGSSGSNARNPSGLLVYQVGSMAVIDGKPVPEVGTWLPLAAALGLLAWFRFRP